MISLAIVLTLVVRSPEVQVYMLSSPMTALFGVRGSKVLLATAVLCKSSLQRSKICGVSQWPPLPNFMKSTMVAFPTDMATTTQGQHLQLAHDLKVTNILLETSKDSFMKAPPFRREEASS